MKPKNYQTISLEHFISLFEKNPLEFPLNILEIKPTHYTQYYKKITKTTQKKGWANASKKIKSNWFLRLLHSNKKVKYIFEKNQINQETVEDFVTMIEPYEIPNVLDLSFFGLDRRSRILTNFIVSSKQKSRIIVDGGWLHLGLMFAFCHFTNDFIGNKGQCILVRNRHFADGYTAEDCFKGYKKEWIKNADENLKVWYLD